MNYLTFIFPVQILGAIGLFYIYYSYRCRNEERLRRYWPDPAAISPILDGQSEHGEDQDEIRAKILQEKRTPFHLFYLTRSDILPMLIITFIYAVVAFINLGNTYSAESFRTFEEGDSTSFEFSEPVDISKVMYFSGLGTGSYKLYFSSDGINYSEQVSMEQNYDDIFKWQTAELDENTCSGVRFVKIRGTARFMELGELAIFNENGIIPLETIVFDESDAALFDEQENVPEQYLYENSTYFDEIYHARTAYEHLENIYPYEVSHPPLGKLIISIGISIFGLNPFGWRFMGTLFGVLMLPLMYIFLKNIFGKTAISVCGTVLFASDFMHFTQTRIATIDTYGVFFIMLMFLFMYRYIAQPYDTPFRKTALPLFLSGLFFGIGSASKWIVIYGGAGLCVIYIIHQVRRGLYCKYADQLHEYWPYLIKTLLFSILSFIVIPLLIYYISYWPYGTSQGMSVPSMFFSSDYFKTVWDNQVFMFTYHSGLEATHSYGSPWWQWVLDIRPILYYREYFNNDTIKSAISAFGNPAVWWGGLPAIFILAWSAFKRHDGIALFILIGYLAQLLPWTIITRVVFIYHYFPSTVFLILALSYIFNRLWEINGNRSEIVVIAYTSITAVLFIMFYPSLSAMPVSQWYTSNILRWLYSWPV